jgi:hypothetical protein
MNRLKKKSEKFKPSSFLAFVYVERNLANLAKVFGSSDHKIGLGSISPTFYAQLLRT